MSALDVHRVRRVRIRPELLATFLRDGHECTAGQTLRPATAMPRDLRITCAKYDHRVNLLELDVHSETFERVPVGIEPPLMDIAFTSDSPAPTYGAMRPERKQELRDLANSPFGSRLLATALTEALHALDESEARAESEKASADYERDCKHQAEAGWKATLEDLELAVKRGVAPEPGEPAATGRDGLMETDIGNFKRNEVIENLFTYHAPTESQKAAYEEIRESAKRLAYVIDAHCAPGPDRTTAIRKLREAVMTANASIATNNAQYR